MARLAAGATSKVVVRQRRRVHSVAMFGFVVHVPRGRSQVQTGQPEPHAAHQAARLSLQALGPRNVSACGEERTKEEIKEHVNNLKALSRKRMETLRDRRDGPSSQPFDAVHGRSASVECATRNAPNTRTGHGAKGTGARVQCEN
jgi:hypothetical protein